MLTISQVLQKFDEGGYHTCFNNGDPTGCETRSAWSSCAGVKDNRVQSTLRNATLSLRKPRIGVALQRFYLHLELSDGNEAFRASKQCVLGFIERQEECGSCILSGGRHTVLCE